MYPPPLPDWRDTNHNSNHHDCLLMKIDTYLSLYNYRGTQFFVVCVWNLEYCSGCCRTAPSTFLIPLALPSYTWFSRRCSAFWWCEYSRYGVFTVPKFSQLVSFYDLMSSRVFRIGIRNVFQSFRLTGM